MYDGLLWILIILLFHSQVLYAQEDWISFRGDRHLTGVASGSFPENPQLLWTFQTEDGIESTAAIYSGTVYACSLDGYLYAIDLQDGKLVWKYKAGNEIKSSPSVFNGTVFFGDEAGKLHAVDAGTGKPRWIFRTGSGIISSANFVSGHVLFGSYDQHLYCLSGEGTLIWKFETEGYLHGTPAVVDDRTGKGVATLVAGCDGFLRVIGIRDGVEQKKISLGSYVGASPAVFNGMAFVGSFDNEVLGIDLDEAAIRWRYEPEKNKFPFYASAAVTNGWLIVGGRDKRVHALDPQTGRLRWISELKSRIDSSPVILGDRVFFGTSGGDIYGLDLNTGEPVWHFITGSPMVASPCIAGGRLIVGSVDGVLYCFGAKS